MERMKDLEKELEKSVGEIIIDLQREIRELEEENKKLKKEREMLIEDLSCDKELQQQIAQKQREYYEENKKLKATLDAYAKQINRLEQRLLKYEKVHDGKFIEKDITTSESKPLFNN